MNTALNGVYYWDSEDCIWVAIVRCGEVQVDRGRFEYRKLLDGFMNGLPFVSWSKASEWLA